LFFWILSKHRAENLTAALDPTQVQGLATEKEFNPHTGVTYVEIREGQNRNVAFSNLGNTLPIISRFNFKSMPNTNYELIGEAPWALTTNFAANLSDPELMGYLLANDTMIKAFLNRPDVAPLLEDPQLLVAFTEDAQAMQEFFTDTTVKAVLDNPQMVRTVMKSRFMSYLLISKAGKYFRSRPQEAEAIIDKDPYLSELRLNVGVQQAVKENPYLKNIADQLLRVKAAPKPAPAPTVAPASDKKGKDTAKKKKGGRGKK